MNASASLRALIATTALGFALITATFSANPGGAGSPELIADPCQLSPNDRTVVTQGILGLVADGFGEYTISADPGYPPWDISRHCSISREAIETAGPERSRSFDSSTSLAPSEVPKARSRLNEGRFP